MAVSPILAHPSHHTTQISPLALKNPRIATKGALNLEQALQSLDDPSITSMKPEHREALYNSLITLSISNKALHAGNRLLSHLALTGFEPGLFLENQFINLYSKCGEVTKARELFGRMGHRNVVTWNAMISGYCSNDHFLDAITLFQDMVEMGEKPDVPTYLSVLRACVGSGNPQHGQQIHALVVKEDLDCCIKLGNSLISMYSKLGRLEDAQQVFERMVERDTISWNSLITAGDGHRALSLFVDMQKEGLIPDEFTFGSLFGSDEAVAMVEELHSQVIKRGLVANVFTGSALLGTYARCGNLQSALQLFDAMPERNTVAWNSTIAACFDNGATHEGLHLFLQMTEAGILPDEYSISILIKAAADQLLPTSGKQFHGLAVKTGSQRDTLTGNSLIAMYCKHETTGDSWRAFKDITEPDLISWNSLAHSYVQNERFEQALDVFMETRRLGFQPDDFSFIAALGACASLAWLGTGRGVHCDMIKTGLLLDTFIGCALVDMYCKSMATADAMKVFDEIKSKDLITWNSMIAGFAMNADLHGVLKLLNLMREENLQPDNFTFASILAASADAASMQLGRQIHTQILKSDLNPDTTLFNALLTMYTKAGSIEKAEQVFSELKDRNEVSWTSMIGGYAQSGYSREALLLFNEMERRETPSGKTFVALLTACSYGGLQEEGEKYFEMMEAKYGIKPDIEHYACMVDLLGRAGRLFEAEAIIEGMPYKPEALLWRILLSSCRVHGDMARGKRAMKKILALEPGDSAAYVLASNLNAAAGDWESVEEVRELMRRNGVKKESAKSWIEVDNRVHEFMAGECLHPRRDEICLRLTELFKQMKEEKQEFDYTPYFMLQRV